MKQMMEQSLVVRTGCGTPLWSRGGKGEGEGEGEGEARLESNKTEATVCVEGKYVLSILRSSKCNFSPGQPFARSHNS